MSADESNWDLVTPFLTDDPVFAYGVEFGMLYCTLQRILKESDPGTVFREMCHRENQDRICVLLNRHNCEVVSMEPVDDTWFTLVARIKDEDRV